MSLFYDFKLKRQKKTATATTTAKATGRRTASSSSSESTGSADVAGATSSCDIATDSSSPSLQLIPKAAPTSSANNTTATTTSQSSSRQSTDGAHGCAALHAHVQQNIVPRSEDSGKCSPEMESGSATTSLIHSPANSSKKQHTNSDDEHPQLNARASVQHTSKSDSNTLHSSGQPVSSAVGMPPSSSNSSSVTVNCAGASSVLTCFNGSVGGAPNKIHVQQQQQQQQQVLFTPILKTDELVFPSAAATVSQMSPPSRSAPQVAGGVIISTDNNTSNNNNNIQPKPQPSDFSIKNVLLQSQLQQQQQNDGDKLLYVSQHPTNPLLLTAASSSTPTTPTTLTSQQQPSAMFNLNQLLALAAVQQQQQQQQLVTNGGTSSTILLPQHLLQTSISPATSSSLTVQQQLAALQNALQSATLQQQQQQQQTQQQLLTAALLSQQQQLLATTSNAGASQPAQEQPPQANTFVSSILYKALLYGRQSQQQQVPISPTKLQAAPAGAGTSLYGNISAQSRPPLLQSKNFHQQQSVTSLPASSSVNINRTNSQFNVTPSSASTMMIPASVGGPSRMLHPTTDINIYDSRAPSSTPTPQLGNNSVVSASPTVHLNHIMNGGSVMTSSVTKVMEHQQQHQQQQQQQHFQQARASHHLNGSSSMPSICPPHTNVCAGEDLDIDDPPMVCMICSDTATGLHYGIITCEGCKGFFKRTVQNKRIYTCVGDGKCEITKTQRNRCQYCRFEKCRRQGMVIAAVREDRMPGGRNSGAVYNMYKVKYRRRKHKAVKSSSAYANNSAPQHQQHNSSSSGSFAGEQHKQPSLASSTHSSSLPTPYDPPQQQYFFPPPSSSASSLSTLQLFEQQQQRHLAALQQQHNNDNNNSKLATNSAMVLSASHHHHQQQVMMMMQPKQENQPLLMSTTLPPHSIALPTLSAVSRAGFTTGLSSTGKEPVHVKTDDENMAALPPDGDDNDVLVRRLIELDQLEDVATLKNMPNFFDDTSGDLTARLRTMGDSMVFKLVQWTRTLPMLADLPAEQVTALLENKWHVILLITTSVYRAMYKPLRIARSPSAAQTSSSPPDSPQRSAAQQQKQAADSTSSSSQNQSSSASQNKPAATSSSSSAQNPQASSSSSSSASAQQQHPRKAAILGSESARGLPSPPLSTDSSSHGSDGLIPVDNSPRSASAPIVSASTSASASSSSSSIAANSRTLSLQEQQLQLKSRTVDEEFNDALEHLRGHLGRLLQKTLTTEELVRDIGGVLRQLVMLVHALRQLDLTREEYVVLKVLLMLQDVAGATQAASLGCGTKTESTANEGAAAAAQLRVAYQRYLHCFMAIAERKHGGTGAGAQQRVQLLFGLIPYVQNAAALLLQHKMFYVPFLLNS